MTDFRIICKTGALCGVCRLRPVHAKHRAAWREKFSGVPDDDVSCLFGKKWIDESDNSINGLGDLIAAGTKLVGIKPCEGCKRRQEALNDLVPFK